MLYSDSDYRYAPDNGTSWLRHIRYEIPKSGQLDIMDGILTIGNRLGGTGYFEGFWSRTRLYDYAKTTEEAAKDFYDEWHLDNEHVWTMEQDLTEGWNLVGAPGCPMRYENFTVTDDACDCSYIGGQFYMYRCFVDITRIFGDHLGQIDSIWKFDNEDQEFVLLYADDVPLTQWNQSITEGYWVDAKEDFSIETQQYIYHEMEIYGNYSLHEDYYMDLEPGWNLIGLPALHGMAYNLKNLERYYLPTIHNATSAGDIIDDDTWDEYHMYAINHTAILLQSAGWNAHMHFMDKDMKPFNTRRRLNMGDAVWIHGTQDELGTYTFDDYLTFWLISDPNLQINLTESRPTYVNSDTARAPPVLPTIGTGNISINGQPTNATLNLSLSDNGTPLLDHVDNTNGKYLFLFDDKDNPLTHPEDSTCNGTIPCVPCSDCEEGYTGSNSFLMRSDAAEAPIDMDLRLPVSYTNFMAYEDLDGDGWTQEHDCDDANASIHPGASEICDGVDNDCDAQTDNNISDRVNGSDAGTCEPEIQSCIDGTWTVTEPAVLPETEICDGLDNDCNNLTDDDIADIYNGTDIGVCRP